MDFFIFAIGTIGLLYSIIRADKVAKAWRIVENTESIRSVRRNLIIIFIVWIIISLLLIFEVV